MLLAHLMMRHGVRKPSQANHRSIQATEGMQRCNCMMPVWQVWSGGYRRRPGKWRVCREKQEPTRYQSIFHKEQAEHGDADRRGKERWHHPYIDLLSACLGAW